MTFDDNAKIGSSVCNIVFTGRDMGTGWPQACVPYHAVESYLAKLFQAGYKIAVVEQTKALMTRELEHSVKPNRIRA